MCLELEPFKATPFCLGVLLMLSIGASFAADLAAHSETRANNTVKPAGDMSKVTNSSSSTHRARQPVEVTRSRTAHGHARNNHAINRLSISGAGVHMESTMSRPSNLSPGGHGDSLQHIVVSAGHDESKGKGEHNEHHSDKRDKSEHKQASAKERHRHDKNGQANLPNSGNQGIGDGSNVSVNTETVSDEVNGVKTIVLHEGTAFTAHEKPVNIKTDRGEVRIAPRSAVYVVSQGKSVAVYNIADHKDSDVVVVTPGSRKIQIKAGEQLLLTHKDNVDFAKAHPQPSIHSSHPKELGTENETRIFHAEFSPVQALSHADGFQSLVDSKNKTDKGIVDHILKTAAVVSTLRGSDDSQ